MINANKKLNLPLLNNYKMKRRLKKCSVQNNFSLWKSSVIQLNWVPIRELISSHLSSIKSDTHDYMKL